MAESNLALRPVRYWTAAVLLAAALLAIIAWRERPPRPRPRSIPASEFSAERAWRVLSYLADTSGYRVSGTPGARRAAEYLAGSLREIPGVEVEVQAVSGARSAGRGVIGYTLHNVIARIPGRTREAVLLSAHYDTPVGSVGAGDDGVAAASLVEVVRAIAAGPRLERSIIVLINDGEEQGLLGSHGFVQHPWFSDVRTFVNLESAGPHGKAILFQAGVNGGPLVSAYARSVPYPYGTVLGQDIFQSGAIPSDTDFRIYRDFGQLVGLDIALYRGGWAYHTQRDRTWNVSPGSVQQVGGNALALARELASDAVSTSARDGRAVYYDVLGLFMVRYGERTARILAILATLLAVVAVAAAAARGVTTVRATAASLLALVASTVGAVAAALALGAAAAYLAGRPMSWYAHPWWGVSAFAIAALTGALAVWRGAQGRRGVDPRLRACAAHAALLIFWVIVLALLSLERIGSAYIALWWVVGLAAALLASAIDRGRRWQLWFAVCAIPAGVLTLQLLVLLAMLFVPVFGRLPLTVAPDVVLAAMIAVPAGAIALALLPGLRLTGGAGRATLVALVAALALMGVSLLQHRYTEGRPQRLHLVHYDADGTSTLRVYGMDYATPRSALAGDSALRPVPGSGERPLEFVAPAEPNGFPAPTVAVVDQRADSAAGTRTLTLRVRSPGAYRLRIDLVRGRLAGWSLPAALPRSPSDDGELRLDWVAPPDSGIVLSLEVRGSDPLSLHAAASRFTTTPAAAALIRTLPPWTDVSAVAISAGEWSDR